MAYFKINNVDYSKYVSGLKVISNGVYNSQTNASGNTVVDYINTKRTIEVTFIMLDKSVVSEILQSIKALTASLSFVDPLTAELSNNVTCILPSNEVEFYTIQAEKTQYKAFTLKFTEL